MTDQLLIRMTPELKRKLGKAATLEGKTTTQVVRDLIEGYVRDRDMPAYVAGLWDRIAGDMAEAGVKRSDVRRAIKASRRARGRDAGGR